MTTRKKKTTKKAAGRKGSGARKNPALAATEKARNAAIAEIDKNIAEDAKQEHKAPPAKSNTPNRAQRKVGSKAGSKAGRSSSGKRTAAKKAASKKSKMTKKGAKKKTAQAKVPRTKKRVSLLDAAATVLQSAKEPMTAKAIVEQVIAKKLWTSPGGKTPAATLYSAMIREITNKGRKARFRRVDRGLFTTSGRGRS